MNNFNTASALYNDMLNQTHILIAGATGSGKSVIINGIIATALKKSQYDVNFILIDPKRVELAEYKNLPHTIAYACEPDDMVKALEYAIERTDSRYRAMANAGLKKWEHGKIYVIIDELADLMTTDKKRVMPLIQRLCQIGRAAGVVAIAATQCPLATVIPTPIKVNFDTRIGLHTVTAQHSRNIIEFTGCETLPRYGKAYYITPEGMNVIDVPMIDDATRHAIVEHWLEEKAAQERARAEREKAEAEAKAKEEAAKAAAAVKPEPVIAPAPARRKGFFARLFA
ncbi:MAG: hypothetical protein J6W84_03495 [Bacteroidales bacterium]|nr:hypothetical protein [Bacteroidales bacterium]